MKKLSIFLGIFIVLLIIWIKLKLKIKNKVIDTLCKDNFNLRNDRVEIVDNRMKDFTEKDIKDRICQICGKKYNENRESYYLRKYPILINSEDFICDKIEIILYTFFTLKEPDKKLKGAYINTKENYCLVCIDCYIKLLNKIKERIKND